MDDLVAPVTITVPVDGRDVRAGVRRTCDRIDAVDPLVHAFVPEPGRRERMLAEADGVSARWPGPADRPAAALRRPRRRQGHRPRRRTAHHRRFGAAARGPRRTAGSGHRPPPRRRGDHRRQDGHRRIGRHRTRPDPQPARPRPHARRVQQRIGGRRRGRHGPARPRHPDHRLDDPPGRLLRRARLQALPRPHPRRRRHRQHRVLRHPRTLRRRSAGPRRRGREDALAAREETRRGFATATAAAGVDVWISPAATGPAPAGLGSTGDPVMCLPWSYLGLPVLNLPAGHAPDGLPLGLQCTGAPAADERLLAAAPGIAAALRGA